MVVCVGTGRGPHDRFFVTGPPCLTSDLPGTQVRVESRLVPRSDRDGEYVTHRNPFNKVERHGVLGIDIFMEGSVQQHS